MNRCEGCKRYPVIIKRMKSNDLLEKGEALLCRVCWNKFKHLIKHREESSIKPPPSLDDIINPAKKIE